MKAHINVGTKYYEHKRFDKVLRSLVTSQFVLLVVIIGCFALAAHMDSLGGF